MRDRFVGLAFAAADLLTEINADRRLTFTAGAFRERFGADSESFTGKPFSNLIAPEDQAGLEIALNLFAARGRLPPISLRLSNAERTPMAVAGLCLPHHNGIAWITLARIPAAAPQGAALAAAAVFQEAMEARGMTHAPGRVGLVEVGGWTRLDPAHRRTLEDDIAHALREAGGAGAMATEMADGKFGVLGGDTLNLAELQAQIGRILRNAGAARPVAGVTIPLAALETSGPPHRPDAPKRCAPCGSP